MASRQSTRGAAMLVFTTLAWGAMFAVAKGALASIDAFWLTAWRYVPASLAMDALLWLVEGRRAFATDGAGLRLWAYGSLGLGSAYGSTGAFFGALGAFFGCAAASGNDANNASVIATAIRFMLAPVRQGGRERARRLALHG